MYEQPDLYPSPVKVWPYPQFVSPPLAHANGYGSSPKILLYSHDTFGLGNISRTLLLSRAMGDEFANASILIVTGSPVIHAFKIPDGIDYIKLPSLDRVDTDRFEPSFLKESSYEVKKTRQEILRSSILGFNPDLMIVDKRPGGIDGELIETLEALRKQKHSTKLVLGIRDILDEPAQTRLSLQRTGSFEMMKTYYDEVWIYGHPSIFDAVKEYGFPEDVARKTFYCGYLRRPTAVEPSESGPPHVLVTTGGGGDGSDVVETYLEGLLDLPRRIALRSDIVFGPQMQEARRAAILARYGHLADVQFHDFEPDLTQRYAEADLVISMAGYNTICELLSFGRRAILVPRETPVREQLIRAQLLAARGYFDLIQRSDLTPKYLIHKVMAALQQGSHIQTAIDLDGLPRIRERARRLLNGKAS